MRVLAALLFAALASSVGTARASDFPAKPVRLVVPFGPGGITDVIARQVAKGMGDKLGQPVIIENKPSAGHIVAMQTVARAPADGYTILLGSNTGFTVAPHMYKSLGFDIAALQPIAPINTAPTVLLARPDFPANNLTELIRLAKASPNGMTYGSFGVGSSAHLGMEAFKKDTGIEMTHVPYKGDAPGLLALMAKEVDVAFITLFSAQARIRSGEFKAIGTLQNEKLANFPEVQTTLEAGSRNAGMPVWIAFFATPGTPAEVMKKLEDATRATVSTPDFKEFLRSRGAEPLEMSNEQLMRFIQEQSSRAGPIVQAIGLKAD